MGTVQYPVLTLSVTSFLEEKKFGKKDRKIADSDKISWTPEDTD